MPTTFSTSAVNAECTALTNLLDGGFLRIYGGEQPETPDTPVTEQPLLAELRFSSPAFEAPVSGVAAAATISPALSASGTGNATWYRCFAADGVTAVHDGSVGSAGSGDLNFPTTSIQAGVEVRVLAFSLRVPQA